MRSKFNSPNVLLAVLLPHLPRGGAEEVLLPAQLPQADHWDEAELVVLTNASVSRDLAGELLG